MWKKLLNLFKKKKPKIHPPNRHDWCESNKDGWVKCSICGRERQINDKSKKL